MAYPRSNGNDFVGHRKVEMRDGVELSLAALSQLPVKPGSLARRDAKAEALAYPMSNGKGGDLRQVRSGMSKRQKIAVGDVYEIQLPNERWAYAQYLQHNNKLGYLIRVFDRVSDEPVRNVAELELGGNLFPPVFMGLLATVRSGRWKLIGNLPVEQFTFPRFRNTSGTKPGRYHNWYLWDGTDSVRIGDLPVPLRALELEQVWGDEGLEERIVAGTYRGDQMF